MQNDRVSKNIPILLSSLVLISYFLGFYLDENSAGSGADTAELGDLVNTWNNLEMFLSNSIMDGVNATSSLDQSVYKSSRTPLVYIFHKIFNPFTDSINSFRRSVFFFSLLGPIIFFFCLKQRFRSTKNSYLILISSLILLSPYFRTSAFWGNEENFGIISTLLSYLFLQLFLNESRYRFRKIFLLTFTIIISSLSVYFDHKLLLIPIICYFYILMAEDSISIKIFSTLIYIFCSIPFIYLIYIWGNIIPSGDASYRVGKLHFTNVGYAVTIISFYLLPLFFFFKKFSQILVLKFFKQKTNINLLLLFIVYIVINIIFLGLHQDTGIGKGYIFKLSNIMFGLSIYQNIFIYFSFIITWTILIFTFQKKIINILISSYFLILSIFTWPLLQEYFDPLIFILAFTFFKFDLKINYKNSIFIFCYMGLFLIACNIYYNNLLN
jgi:hypothetical protein